MIHVLLGLVHNVLRLIIKYGYIKEGRYQHGGYILC